MKTIFIAATLAATGAVAQEAATANPVLSGEVSLDFAETPAGDWGGSMGVELDVNAGGVGNVALGFEAGSGGALALDTWTVGTEVSGIGIAMGNDNGVFVGAEGEHTLAAPSMAESIRVSAVGADVALGFTDWTSDVTDLNNIQVAYGTELSFAKIKAAVDYNFNSENILLGTEVGLGNIGIAEVGGTVTYDVDAEKIGFETVAEAFGATAYLNGDQDEMLQNIGGKYSYNLAGAELSAGANYNLDAEELTPTVGLSFSF